jgi:hypothetical protein
VRPSIRPLSGLLRMTFFLNAIKDLRHPEARPQGASRRTPDIDASEFPTASFAGTTRAVSFPAVGNAGGRLNAINGLRHPEAAPTGPRYARPEDGPRAVSSRERDNPRRLRRRPFFAYDRVESGHCDKTWLAAIVRSTA